MRKLLREEARELLLDILPGYMVPDRMIDAFPDEFSVARPSVEDPTPPVYRFEWCKGKALGWKFARLSLSPDARATVPASLVMSAALEISGADKQFGDQMMASYGFAPGDIDDPGLKNGEWSADPEDPLHVTFRWTYRGRDVTVRVPEALVVHAIRIGREKLARKVDATGDDLEPVEGGPSTR